MNSFAKRYMQVMMLVSCAYFYAYADDCDSCSSFAFEPRAITPDLVYVDSFNLFNRWHNEHAQRFIYSGTVFYQRSNKSDRLGSAFLLRNGCNSISVTQNPPAQAGDVNSFWFGLRNNDPANPFIAKYSIEPQRRAIGLHNYVYADLSSCICGLWFDAAAAIVNAAHNLHSCEVGNSATACPGITTVTTALNNPLYMFGKFFARQCDNSYHRTGLDDIQLRLGYDWQWTCPTNHAHNLSVYAIGTIPTGRKPNAAYIFEPLVGSRHGSLGIGFMADRQCWSDCDGNRSVTVLTDINYRYVFAADECRTFDLCKNGPMSRFLLVATQDNPSVAYPAINFLTQSVSVKPQSTVQWWLAMHYATCAWDFEVGYDLFWRQREKIGKCAPAFNQTIGIYQLNCMGVNCTSASTATIAQGPNDIVADSSFVALQPSDVNLQSGLAETAFTNKFYAAAAYDGCICNDIEWQLMFGGSYEFVTNKHRCAALPYWALFGRFGFMF